MRVEPIENPSDPRVAAYRHTPDPDRLRQSGLLVAEGRLVVRRLIEHGGFNVRSVLVTEAALRGLELARPAGSANLALRDVPIYLCAQQVLNEIGGFNFHRGCLALAERPAAPSLDDLLGPPHASAVVVALEGVGNPDNVGASFRNAQALGARAVLLGPGCGDPFYRKAIRVSMGSVFSVLFAELDDWQVAHAAFRASGYVAAAMTPQGDITLDAFARSHAMPSRVVLLLGAEGTGLSEAALAGAAQVRIPMAPGVDSLNVATAAAIALHRLGPYAREGA